MMAAWMDLSLRLGNGIADCDNLAVEAIYHGTGLPAWLAKPLADVASTAAAGGRLPVLVVNARGQQLGEVLVVMPLAAFEAIACGNGDSDK